MSAAYRRAPGVRVAPLGDEGFAVYSALSGETHIVNAESVAVLEALDEHEAQPAAQVVRRLAQEHGIEPDELAAALAQAWPALLRAGLVCEPRTHDSP